MDKCESIECEGEHCQECEYVKFSNQRIAHNKECEKDTNRFKWRYFDCADGFVFILDGKEYTNLKELAIDINKAIK